ncbi:MAG: diaminopimelate decarboxylase [Caldilineaceae bacterium]|nr:diaminopimelate decarboxylase [Caldilineaceae bacterium]
MYRDRLSLLPDTVALRPDKNGAPSLHIGDRDLNQLAAEWGTPLYIYDQRTIDNAVQAYQDALSRHYPGPAGITYAGKASLNLAMARLMAAHGLLLDCTGVGEMHIARTAGVPPAQILLHGVNKSQADLRAGLVQAGTLVVDNLPELARIAQLAQARVSAPALWLRVRPGYAVDTHQFRQTGQHDSKFGMDADECVDAVAYCQRNELRVTGLHFHQGSHFHAAEQVLPALDMVCALIGRLQQELDWWPQVLSPGGGWGIAYHEADLPHQSIEFYVATVAAALAKKLSPHSRPLPRLQPEPGRSLVARAGVAIYRVGTVKHAGGRRWLLLDGGMADNIRPALYQARYSALPVTDPLGRPPVSENAWLAGPYCESGDLLIEDLPLPEIEAGELLAVPVSGAYQLMMASNYNGALRPAVVMLRDGVAQLVQRRETVDDLLLRDIV